MVIRSFSRSLAAVVALAPLSILGASLLACTDAGAGRASPRQSAAGVVQTALQQVDGTLEHVSSIPFETDPAILATVTGLEKPTVARTSTGGAIELTFVPGTPHAKEVASVVLKRVAKPDPTLIFDPLAPPAEIPSRPGFQVITTYRIAGQPSRYLVGWRNAATKEESITIFDGKSPQAVQPVVARSSARILGIAVQPVFHAANAQNVIVWTTTGKAGGATVGFYRWKPETPG